MRTHVKSSAGLRAENPGCRKYTTTYLLHGWLLSSPLPSTHTRKIEGRLIRERNVFTQDWEDCECDGNIERDPNHTWPCAGVELHGAIVLHNLHEAIHCACVQFLGLFSLHSRLDCVLWHGQYDRHCSGDGTCCTIVNRMCIKRLVPTSQELLGIKLHGETNCLVCCLFGDGGHQTHVQAFRSFALEDLHHRVY